MAWTRSNFANFPKVHCKFWAKDTNGVDLVEYRIQDVEDDGHEDVILHMIKYFLPDEPTFSSRGAANDVVLQNEISSVWRRVLKQRVSLVCYKGNSTEIIAVNILHVSTTERSKLEVNKYKLWYFNFFY